MKQVGTAKCTRWMTEFSHPDLTVDAVKAILDPLNWPIYGFPFYWQVTQLEPCIDANGWSRVIEEIGPLRLRTAFKYWKADVDDGAVVNYDLDDDREQTADSGLVLVDRGYISVAPLAGGGVRLRLTKEFLIRGLKPAVAAAFVGAVRLDEMGQQCMLRTALRPPPDTVAWKVSERPR